ncbi:MAG: hypothetical protein A2X23_08875 [Chloroflexi bacterium GWC2_73_18]|nr:MAG: hypothetical protein A2X23_08875 [Chloroflexi bacterium GWC2_73_18]
MDRRHPTALALVALVALLVAAACTALEAPSSEPTAPPPTPTPTPPATPVALRVGLGFIPSVQFAPFYLADERGYYREAGLVVTLENKIDPDLVPLVGQGAIDVGMADGTSVITARSQGIPIRYVATVYARFPSVVFALEKTGIRVPADLKGRTVGIPGRYGSSYIMLQALLASAHLTLDDVTLVDFPDFGQGAAVEQGRVEAATGFVNNEPLQAERRGTPVTVLRVDEVTPLPGPGLATGDATLQLKRDALARFAAATLRAMDEIAADPKLGLDAAIRRVPELGADREMQLAVLEATIDTWKSTYTLANGFGAIDRAAWSASLTFMQSLPGLVAGPVVVDDLVSTDLLP